MSKSLAHFSSQELARVLSHYDIGIIEKLSPLIAGNSRAPKLMLHSTSGMYVLKRRPHGKDNPDRIAFAHHVQKQLARTQFPVAPLISTRDNHSTMLNMDKHVYELFQFVNGSRYTGSPHATADAGLQLALFHSGVAQIKPSPVLMQSSFHDSKLVRKSLHAVKADTAQFKELITNITELYDSCGRRTNNLGFANWPSQIVHGDWHPGNMLFDNDKIVAVLDFDSMKLAPAVTDLANALLQFSIVGGRPNPVDWPEYLDERKLSQFLQAYLSDMQVSQPQRVAILDLMIETLISEAILPVAVTGSFGHSAGFDFLKMIYRKCNWIDRNRKTLEQIVFA